MSVNHVSEAIMNKLSFDVYTTHKNGKKLGMMDPIAVLTILQTFLFNEETFLGLQNSPMPSHTQLEAVWYVVSLCFPSGSMKWMLFFHPDVA